MRNFSVRENRRSVQVFMMSRGADFLTLVFHEKIVVVTSLAGRRLNQNTTQGQSC